MANVENRGNGSYRLTVILGYDEKGTPIRERKTVKAKNLKEAKKLLTLFEAEILTGEYFKAEDKMTLNAFFPQWLEKHAKDTLSPDTLQNYISILQKRILPKYGHFKLEDIKTIHVVNFINDLKKNGQRLDRKGGKLSASSVLNCYKAFNNVLSCAYRWKLIKENPAIGAKPPNGKAKKSEVYSKEELRQLMQLLEDKPLFWKTLIFLAVSTGAREGEIAGLEWKHVDFEKGTIRIEQAITEIKGKGVQIKGTKTGKDRTVSVPEKLLELLKKLELTSRQDKWKVRELWEWPDHFFIFGNEFGKPIRPDSIGQWWRRFTQKHDFKHIRFHDLRHTSATLLINEGVHAKVISERLGHADISTTMNIYGHVLEEADKTAASHFDSFFEKKA
ncbi:site-specific integrase [Cytobacillus oceanisediminis]|uniref:tyrosine-type recombinase/integrase n=1 Tax=Cytobacillus oceanisediminis TaxID=665099 RepID=UPI001863C6C4|nr:site-specific integrase [Cytobacillus oceanisediminis]MCM3528306.1 site-specific integrase [Cytobacillus oceanisediminis]QOK27642.1 site-specific integrase [Cytobacillus oceanisediminis]